MRRSVLFALIVLGVYPAIAARAGAFVYWSDGAAAGSVGRAELSGAPSPGDQWLPGLGEGCGVAVDATHVYWTSRAGTIGRANLDGTGADPGFVVLPTGNACGVALDSSHLYWASNSSGKLGRANLDGSDLEPAWMSPGMGHGCGIAVDATSVYWATAAGVFSAPLAGGQPATISTVTVDNCGVAVNESHIYWATGEGYIERDRLSGGPPTPIVRAPLTPCGVALDAGHVYWGNSASDSIGRANLDGSGLNQRFATGARSPCGVAVDALAAVSSPAPVERLSNEFVIGRVKKNKRRGSARLELLVPGPGTLILDGRRVLRRELAVTPQRFAPAPQPGPLAIQIPVTPSRTTRAILAAVGRATVRLLVAYTPTGGLQKLRFTRIRLALQPRRSRRVTRG